MLVWPDLLAFVVNDVGACGTLLVAVMQFANFTTAVIIEALLACFELAIHANCLANALEQFARRWRARRLLYRKARINKFPLLRIQGSRLSSWMVYTTFRTKDFINIILDFQEVYT